MLQKYSGKFSEVKNPADMKHMLLEYYKHLPNVKTAEQVNNTVWTLPYVDDFRAGKILIVFYESVLTPCYNMI